MQTPDIVPVVYEGELVAAVSQARVHILAPWLLGRRVGDPELRFVAMMCAYAGQVLGGALPGPYRDDIAEEWARAALIGDEDLSSVDALVSEAAASVLAVPIGQLRAARASRTST